MAIVFTKTKQQDKTKTFLKDPPQILVYCGAGYSFSEYFRPIVNSLIGDCQIEFLQGDYHLTAATIRSLEELSEQESFSYKIVQALGRNLSIFDFHQQIHRMIDTLSKKTFDLLIVSTDFNLVDRYLINFARSKGIRTVIVHSNIMHSEVLRRYRKVMGITDEAPLPQELSAKLTKLRNSKNKINFIFYYLSRRLELLPKKITLWWGEVLNYYLWPAIFSKTVFMKNKYDKFCFTSGRVDNVICYDPMDVAALKQVVPAVKNVYLAKHPSTDYSFDISQDTSRKLLVLLTSYLVELPESQFAFWRDSIKKLSEMTAIDEIHLRFHPRTKAELTWPKKLISAINNLDLRLEIVDNNKDSLAESAANYAGVLGTVSGSIRTVRASCKGFVIGLLKAGGDSLSLLDQDWMLGASEGISWVDSAEEIQAKQLKPFSPSEIERPTTAEIIKKILHNQ